jgi:phospholipid/cholesterol/gamma-HCH transport system substrate-binding protein
MLNTRSIEIWVGIFVAMGMAALFMLAMQVSHLNLFEERDGYRVTARFDNISGLKERAPVTIAGVKVGRVASIDYDPEYYQAIVTLEIEPTHDTIPLGSSANILTSGLLGEKYIGLSMGGGFDFSQDPDADAEFGYLAEGGELVNNQSSIVLEQLIGKFLFSRGDS